MPTRKSASIHSSFSSSRVIPRIARLYLLGRAEIGRRRRVARPRLSHSTEKVAQSGDTALAQISRTLESIASGRREKERKREREGGEDGPASMKVTRPRYTGASFCRFVGRAPARAPRGGSADERGRRRGRGRGEEDRREAAGTAAEAEDASAGEWRRRSGIRAETRDLHVYLLVVH